MRGLFGRREEARRDELIALRATVREQYVLLDERWTAVAPDARVLVTTLDPEDPLADLLAAHHAHATAGVQQATDDLLDADRSHDPEVLQGLPAIEEGGVRWSRVQQLVAAALHAVRNVALGLDDIRSRRRACEARLPLVPDRVAAAREAIVEADERGYATEAWEAALTRVAADLEDAGPALADGRLSQAHDALVRIEADLDRVLRDATTLAARHHELRTRLDRAQGAVDAADRDVHAVTAAVEGLRVRFPPSVWQAVAEVPAQAASALAAAREGLAAATADASMAVQRFAAAAVALDRVDQSLRSIGTLREAVGAVERDVAAAIGQLGEAQQVATARLQETQQFTAQRGADLSQGLRDGLARAAQVLAEASRTAATGQGDPLLALQRMREVAGYSAEALATAHAHVRQRDAYRSEVDGLLRAARREVDRATAVSGVGIGPRSKRWKAALFDAGNALAEARTVLGPDPERAERRGLEVIEIARQVMAEARPGATRP